MATTAMADSISVTIIENGTTVDTLTGTGTSWSLASPLGLTGFTIDGLDVNALDLTAEGFLSTSGMLSSTGADILGIDVTYSGFTVPNSTTTLGSSSSYTDFGMPANSTLTYQSFGGSATNLYEASSALTDYTLETGQNGAGDNTTSPTYFAQDSPYSLSQDYVWNAAANAGGDNLQITGTTTAINVPEGGAALAYLLLAAAACFGAMRMRLSKVGIAA